MGPPLWGDYFFFVFFLPFLAWVGSSAWPISPRVAAGALETFSPWVKRAVLETSGFPFSQAVARTVVVAAMVNGWL